MVVILNIVLCSVDSCLEKRAFFRLISGMHASINIHLSAEYLLSCKTLHSPTPSLTHTNPQHHQVAEVQVLESVRTYRESSITVLTD